MSKEKNGMDAATNGTKSGDVTRINAKEVMKALETAAKAKPTDFEKTEDDFVSSAVWEKNPELRGVYYGSELNEKRINHRLIVQGEDGKPKVVRFQGSAKLTRELSKIEEGDVVRIVYKGQSGLPGGRKLNDFEVGLLSKKDA